MRLAHFMLLLLLAPACLHGGAPLVPDAHDGDPHSGDAAPMEQDSALEPGTVTVATFNVRRYFDMICHTGQCAPGDYEVQMSPEAFESRTQQLGEAILELDADVVLLQEIENQYCLNALLGRLGEGTTVGVIGETHTPASVDVAVVARGELSGVVAHRADTPLVLDDGTTQKFSRELLEVHLLVAGAEVIVVNAHFKSKSNDDPARRLAEAKATRAIMLDIAATNPGALVVLGGDLNDTPSSETLQALEGDGGLFRVASTLPPGGDWTYLWNGSTQALDHLYHATHSAGSVLSDSVEIMRDASGSWGGSDHAAVRARFKLP